MTDYVFLGPSLPRSHAARIHADAVYLDPVAMGDLFLLVRNRARPGDRIAIIDGLFEQLPAVWHKEVLFALEQGIEVHGASSMGALRAAELDSFGMVGHGRIYQAYRDGLIEDDDEVAVAHATAEQGFRSLSDAMASIRLGLGEIRDEGLCSKDQYAELLDLAKQAPYGRRSWAALARHARQNGWSDDLYAALRAAARSKDVKGQDAVQLLEWLASAAPLASPREPARLQRTSFWESLVQQSLDRVDSTGEGDHGGQAELAAQLLAADGQRDEVLLIARALLNTAAPGDAPPADWELLDASLAVARKHGLANSEQLLAWRNNQGLADEGNWRGFLGRVALARRVLPAAGAARSRAISDALRLLGRWDAAEQRRIDIANAYSAGYHKTLTLNDIGLGPEEAESWYRKRLGPMLPNPAAHAERLGFETLRDMLANLAAVAGSELEAAQRREAH